MYLHSNLQIIKLSLKKSIGMGNVRAIFNAQSYFQLRSQ